MMFGEAPEKEGWTVETEPERARAGGRTGRVEGIEVSK